MDDEIISQLRQKFKFCARCRVWYTELGNVGAWKCAFHPCPFNSEQAGEHHRKLRWDCCGRSRQMDGCVDADHRESAADWNEDDSIEMDASTALKLGAPAEALEISDNFSALADGTVVSKVIVSRFDVASFNSHTNFAIPTAVDGFDSMLQANVHYVCVPGKGLQLKITPK